MRDVAIPPERVAALSQALTWASAPASVLLAWSDWLLHQGAQTARTMDRGFAPMIAVHAPSGATRSGVPSPSAPPFPPHEFEDEGWSRWPFRFYRDAFVQARAQVEEIIRRGDGVDAHHQQLLAFAARQWIDACSPRNLPWTNPTVVDETIASHGANLVRGALNWTEDLARLMFREAPAEAKGFVPGKDVAVTPGKVIYRNRLIELIQYAPQTPTVHAEPLLVISAWIMKYYVLDLSPGDSLIRYLVANGHTVFAISWKNPDRDDADIGMADYLDLGVMAALDVIGRVVPDRRVHAVGYCLGGTLLATGAAAMARDGDERLATLTLLASQTDFSEPGELSLFIDESQLAFLEELMSRDGYLDATYMAAAFRLLRATDLIWKPAVDTYLLGKRQTLTDLLAWNADGTRLPYRMHADYLRSFFHDNALAAGRYAVRSEPVCLNDLRWPVFLVGTDADHVAPWRSVYKLHHLCRADITFVLTNGGHNAGIVSEPGHPHRAYRILERTADARYRSPDAFLAKARHVQGSWWPALQAWLASHSPARVPPPAMGAEGSGIRALADAPGSYVLMR